MGSRSGFCEGRASSSGPNITHNICLHGAALRTVASSGWNMFGPPSSSEGKLHQNTQTCFTIVCCPSLT